MKIRRWSLLVGLVVLLLTCAPALAGNQVLFQTSTLQALMNGVYDGDFSFGELKKHGDFGLGTFDALDGEMVVEESRFYQVKSDGLVYPVTDAMKTPFAEVTFFKPEKTLAVSEPLDLKQLENFLLTQLPSRNFPYALKLTGKFAYIKTRSVPRQAKPYPPLVEVVKKQAVFEFKEVDGVIVGFWHPQYLEGINVAGYHFHFLTQDRKAGGHLLDCRIKLVKVELAQLQGLRLRLPDSAAFSQTDLTGDKKLDIEKAEK